jgi:hypothetical protein
MDDPDFIRIGQQIAAAVKAASEVARPLLEAQRQWDAALQSAISVQLRDLAPLTPQLFEVQRVGQRMADAIAPFLKQAAVQQAALQPVLTQIARAFEDLPPRQKHALEVLLGDGWYLDPVLTFPQVLQVSQLIRDGKHDQARATLCAHFDSRIERLQRHLAERFPARKRLLRAAFRAHQTEDYALSIPVLLAQADGICVELMGVQLYARRDGKPKIADVLELESQTPLMASLLHPLTTPASISASQSERQAGCELLNRHAVLHGESTDYDTRENACRAVSLIAYVAWILDKA